MSVYQRLARFDLNDDFSVDYQICDVVAQKKAIDIMDLDRKLLPDREPYSL